MRKNNAFNSTTTIGQTIKGYVTYNQDTANSKLTTQFDVRSEELTPKDLEIRGAIPAYAAGVLFRNGLGPREIQTNKDTTFRVNHWFDYLSQVHRFQIHAPDTDHPSVRVTHNSRLTCDGLVKRIQETGDRGGFSFAGKYDPCMSFFQKVRSLFRPVPHDGPRDVDVCVTLSTNFPGLSGTGEPSTKTHDGTKIATLVNKTDNSLMQFLDPQTLEPIGIARQDVLHPDLKGPLSAAHAQSCPETGDVYNYNLNLGRQGTYKIFRVSAASGKTSILATIHHAPAYVHSLFLTEHYVIFCVWNSFFRVGGAAILWTKNYLDAMSDFDSTRPATWFVIDRTPREDGGRGLIATCESEPMFCFHTINAYEEADPNDATKTHIIADLCAYDSIDVLKRFYIDNLTSNSPTAASYADPTNTNSRAYFKRFKLSAIGTTTLNSAAGKAEVLFSEQKGMAPELPSLNPLVKGKKHRFIYGVTDTGKSTFFDGLVKYDTHTRSHTIWSEFGQSAGEPIFVADPESTDEDGGVLLSVVLDGTAGQSYLMVLDARTMTEIGRADVGGVVGFGFHGTHVPVSRI